MRNYTRYAFLRNNSLNQICNQNIVNLKITIGKKNILSNKKRLFSKLQDKKSVTKVFNELSKRYSSRKGGYSRVLKAGFRTGDDAPMAVIELVDRNLDGIDSTEAPELKEDSAA